MAQLQFKVQGRKDGMPRIIAPVRKRLTFSKKKHKNL